MKKRFLDFSMIRGLGFNHVYRSVVADEDGAGSGGGTEEVVVVDENDGAAKKFDAKKFMNDETPNFDKQSNDDKKEGVEEKLEAEEKLDVKVDVKENPSFDIDDYWSTVIEELSDDTNKFELPEELKTGKTKDGKDLTKKDKFNLLRQVITENTDWAEGDPLIEEYISYKELGGKSHQDFLQKKLNEININALSPTQKAELSLKEYRDANVSKTKDKDGNWKEGFTDDDIIAEIEGMSAFKIEQEADNYDRNVINRRTANQKADIDKYNKAFDIEFSKVEKINTDLVSKYLKKLEGKNNVNGFELGEAEITQYKKDIPDFVKYTVKTNELTGVKYTTSPATELLQRILAKPEDTFSLLAYLYMFKTGKIDGYSASLKDKTKQAVEKTLDNYPDANLGNAKSGSFDPKKFMGGK